MEAIDTTLNKKAIKLEGQRKLPRPEEYREMSMDELADVLSLTIKHDHENKVITFLCMLSAYTHKSQINVSFNAPSSSGKTYISTEVAALFPDEDKIELSGASPTSFFYGEGKHDAIRKAKIISLSRKILIFYEVPDPSLQAKLRAVMSHDKWEQNYRITNKGMKGQNKAELIILQGFPATVFCSAGMTLDEQEATRAILLSPELTTEKIREGIRLQLLKGANERVYKTTLESEPKRIALKKRILAIKELEVDEILLPADEDILERFYKTADGSQQRHMRDMAHLIQLIKAVALLNVWHRRQPDGTYMATASDIEQAFNLWDGFVESQNLNVPPAVLGFYNKYILPCYQEKAANPDFTELIENHEIGITRQELGRYHLRVEGIAMNDQQVRKDVLPMLMNSGLISQQKPTAKDSDGRNAHIFPLYNVENNIGLGGGSPKEDELDGEPISLDNIPF